MYNLLIFQNTDTYSAARAVAWVLHYTTLRPHLQRLQPFLVRDPAQRAPVEDLRQVIPGLFEVCYKLLSRTVHTLDTKTVALLFSPLDSIVNRLGLILMMLKKEHLLNLFK